MEDAGLWRIMEAMDHLHHLHSVIICLSKMVSLYVTMFNQNLPFRKQTWAGKSPIHCQFVHGKIHGTNGEFELSRTPRLITGGYLNNMTKPSTCGIYEKSNLQRV